MEKEEQTPDKTTDQKSTEINGYCLKSVQYENDPATTNHKFRELYLLQNIIFHSKKTFMALDKMALLHHSVRIQIVEWFI
jgi:hypothetical protein